MKLEKRFVDRHVQMLRDEGINFVTNANVGVNIDINQLKEENDAVVLAIGSTVGRDLRLPGRESEGIYQAMDFLTKNTSELTKNDQELKDSSRYIDAKGLDVIVIGGGDTGNDVLGTSVRQGARSIVNFELLPEPPATRAANNRWPTFARIKRTDYGHAEVIAHWGNDPREYCISTTDFVKDEETGKLKGVNTVKVEWTQKGGQWSMEKIPGSEKVGMRSSVWIPYIHSLFPFLRDSSSRRSSSCSLWVSSRLIRAFSPSSS
jgi:glutamate synthase (NADPH/NADH)